MLGALYAIFKDYGLNVAQLIIICWGGWKIMTNHLKHIQDSLNKIDKKMDVLEKTIQKSNERIATIEGKLS